MCIRDRAETQILNAPYELVQPLSVDPAQIKAQHDLGRSHIFNQLVALRAKLKRMRAPGQQYTLIAGANIISELTVDAKLIKNQGTGDGALANATVGTIAGFNVVEGPYTLDPDEAYLYSSDAFLFWNAAPIRPQGASKYATANKNGISMSWIQDYEASYVIDRSIFATWHAWNYTKDFVSLESTDTGRRFTSPEDYFVRGAKLVLETTAGERADEVREPGDGKGDTPGSEADSFLAKLYKNQRQDDTVDEGLFMPPHLRNGAETQNAAPVVSDKVPGVTP